MNKKTLKKTTLAVLLSFALFICKANAEYVQGSNAKVSLYEHSQDIRVIDGDTISLGNATVVRLLGIDTPELRGKCTDEKEKAFYIKEYLSQRIKKHNNIIRIDLYKKDKYGRSLGNVFIDGSLINNELLFVGDYRKYARPYNGGKRESWCDN